MIQTKNNILRKKALSEGPTYNDFVKAGTAMESSSFQAEKMERTENVNWIQRPNNSRNSDIESKQHTSDHRKTQKL